VPKGESGSFFWSDSILILPENNSEKEQRQYGHPQRGEHRRRWISRDAAQYDVVSVRDEENAPDYSSPVFSD
jgi:hypothetical protein